MPKKEKRSIGEVVRNCRRIAEMSGQALVDKIRATGQDFSNSYLSDIEYGRKTPSEEVARALAKALECDEDYMVMLTGVVPKRIVRRGFEQTAARRAVRELERK